MKKQDIDTSEADKNAKDNYGSSKANKVLINSMTIGAKFAIFGTSVFILLYVIAILISYIFS